MEIANLVLDYLRVLLSAPVLFALIAGLFLSHFSEDIKALLLRVAKIRFPGGAEVSTPQSSRLEEEEGKEPPNPDQVQIQGLPSDLTPEQRQVVEHLIRSHIATAYLWEYRYLNYFLARGTQLVLDWLAGLLQPTTYSHYDTHWLPLIPSANERRAIINALQMHHLVMLDDATGMLSVTPKGHEYREWRGELPPLTHTSTGS